MARRTAKRRSSRRRPLRQNPLSTKQKLGLVGGLVVVGGVAAYALTSGSAPPPVPTGPTVDPRVAKAAECAALQASLVQLRALPTPDRASMTRIEGQIAACLAQARELGVPIDPATAHQSAGDTSKAQIDTWFGEYKATSEHDPLKRNNIRQSILGAGASLAATYADAITQSPNNDATKLIAQSIVQALDAAVSRKLCYLGNERGCSTFGSNEDQPDAKAAQEQDRVIAPLVAAYMQAVAKVGGPGRAIALADGDRFLNVMFRPCTFQKTYIDGQFSHYRATEWSDALKRNNTRRDILADGRALTACLQGLFATASNFGSLSMMRQIGTLAVAAINSSIDRWQCFFSGESGCGTFATNEDQPDVKAAQEMANTAVPLMTFYAQAARTLVSRGDVTAYEPLVTAKLRVCSTMKSYLDAQFSHYKATSYSDALKRNNTRQSMLATGASLAACLQDALSTAISAKSAVPGLSGLGASAPITLAMPLAIPVNVQSLMPSLSLAVTPAPRPVDVVKMVRQVGVVAAAAFDAAVLRKLCYLYDQPGCGRFALNEDHGNDKAAQEQTRVIGPLISVYKQVLLADKDNPQVETPIMRSLLREIDARKNYIDSQYSSLKATSYIDPVKRNNIRDSMIASGRDMVTHLRNAKPVTPAGRALLRTSAQAALQKSVEREACYRTGAAGCDRQWGTWTEPSGAQKADQELAEITTPLRALIADRSAAGLGGFMEDGFAGISGYAWLGIGAAALVAAGAYTSSKKTRRNGRRRTSRRAEA